MKSEKFEQLTKRQLEVLFKELQKYDDLEDLLLDVFLEINKPEVNINELIDIKYMEENYLFLIETPYVIEILKKKGIKNMQELCEEDLENIFTSKHLRSQVETIVKLYRGNKQTVRRGK